MPEAESPQLPQRVLIANIKPEMKSPFTRHSALITQHSFQPRLAQGDKLAL
jgi:hypothetical protein